MLSQQRRQVVREDKAKLKININSLSSHKNSIWFKDVQAQQKAVLDKTSKASFFNWEHKDKIFVDNLNAQTFKSELLEAWLTLTNVNCRRNL